MDVIILTKLSPVAQEELRLSLSVLHQLYCPHGLNTMTAFVSCASLHCLTSFRADESSFVLHLQTSMTIGRCQGPPGQLRAPGMDSTGPVQEPHPHSDSLCDRHHPGHLTQLRCLWAVTKSHHCRDAKLSLLYPVDTGQSVNTKHITAGSPLEGIPS